MAVSCWPLAGVTASCRDARSCQVGGRPLCPLAVSWWLVLLRLVGTHGLCVRCRTARQVLIPSPLTGADARSGIRGVKGYSVVVLTGTDALPLDTLVRPYRDRGDSVDAWNCRADVACVGADLRVRPQNSLRSGEDGRTHRSAPTPTVGASTPPSGSPKKSRPSFRNEKKLRFYLHMNLESRVSSRLVASVVSVSC